MDNDHSNANTDGTPQDHANANAGTGAPPALPSFWSAADLGNVDPTLRDDAADLAGLFAQIDGVGHLLGDHGEDTGHARYGWTIEEAWLRVWFAAQLIARGFAVDVDPAGNQWAWAPRTGSNKGDANENGASGAAETGIAESAGGINRDRGVLHASDPAARAWRGTPEHPGVTIGSHLDSVPGGGAFDGPLGTLSAIAAWDDLVARGHTPACPIGIVHWHDEEGARFAIACFGSRTLTGILPADRALARVDADGITYAQALETFPTLLDRVAGAITRARAGAADVPAIARTLARFDVGVTMAALAASAAPTPASFRAEPDYARRSAANVELHVEQGLAQAGLGAPVAVADQIWPHGRWRVDIDGEANHAGATPMGLRHDPMLAFARFVQAAHEEAARLDVRATIGRVEVTPGGVNVIPGHVTCWLDARADDPAKVTALVSSLERRVEEGQFDTGLAVSNQTNGDTGLAVSNRANGDTGDEVLRLASARSGRQNATINARSGRHDAAATADHDCRIVRESWTEPTIFSADLRDRLARTLDAPIIGTAAGHDAGILAESGRAAGMIFVRNMTGASHTPAEYATLADCARGVRAYANATLACAGAIAQGWRPRP